jgi:hypothetical protein
MSLGGLPVTFLKVLALILGSAFFFPVSCTSTLVAGIFVIARLDAREVARGDQVHPAFLIVVEPGEKGQPFRSVPLSGLPMIRESGGAYSFLMSKPSGRIDVNDYTHLSYRVLENQGTAQVIEVEDDNDDRTVWSRYRATHTDVMPLSSRMFYFGYMFGALPFAFGVALGLYGFGRFLCRRLLKEPPSGLLRELQKEVTLKNALQLAISCLQRIKRPPKITL